MYLHSNSTLHNRKYPQLVSSRLRGAAHAWDATKLPPSIPPPSIPPHPPPCLSRTDPVPTMSQCKIGWFETISRVLVFLDSGQPF